MTFFNFLSCWREKKQFFSFRVQRWVSLERIPLLIYCWFFNHSHDVFSVHNFKQFQMRNINVTKFQTLCLYMSICTIMALHLTQKHYYLKSNHLTTYWIHLSLSLQLLIVSQCNAAWQNQPVWRVNVSGNAAAPFELKEDLIYGCPSQEDVLILPEYRACVHLLHSGP